MQRLYLSKDTRLLLEVVNNEYAVIYSRENIEAGEGRGATSKKADRQEDNGQKVRWVGDQAQDRELAQLTVQTDKHAFHLLG